VPWGAGGCSYEGMGKSEIFRRSFVIMKEKGYCMIAVLVNKGE